MLFGVAWGNLGVVLCPAQDLELSVQRLRLRTRHLLVTWQPSRSSD